LPYALCRDKSSCQATASEAAAFYMERFVLRHRPPKQLITDRRTPFLSRTFADALALYGTKHKPTTYYHPQANGLAERFNRTITTMLSMYVSDMQTNWDVILPFVTFAYNTSYQSSHRFTLFRLVYARDATTQIDRIFPVRSLDNPDVTSHAYLEHAWLDRNSARQSLTKAQNYQTT